MSFNPSGDNHPTEVESFVQSILDFYRRFALDFNPYQTGAMMQEEYRSALWGYETGDESELVKAAIAANKRVGEQKQAEIDAVLGADEIDWERAHELGLTRHDHMSAELFEILGRYHV